MAVSVEKLGPGILTITPPAGAAGTEVDVSCQVTGMKIAWDKDKDDDVDTLCGDVAPGAATYSATLTGTVFQDFGVETGISELSWSAKGEACAFVFVPSKVWARQAAGTVILDPLDFGGDEAKSNMTSDLEWDIVGDPVLSDWVDPDDPPADDGA